MTIVTKTHYVKYSPRPSLSGETYEQGSYGKIIQKQPFISR